MRVWFFLFLRWFECEIGESIVGGHDVDGEVKLWIGWWVGPSPMVRGFKSECEVVQYRRSQGLVLVQYCTYSRW